MKSTGCISGKNNVSSVKLNVFVLDWIKKFGLFINYGICVKLKIKVMWISNIVLFGNCSLKISSSLIIEQHYVMCIHQNKLVIFIS